MNVIYSVKDYVSNVFQSAAGSGAIDVVVVQQSDGLLRCSPFHVHFGHKLKQEAKQQVTLQVNGQIIESVRMKLGDAGEAYFVHQVQEPVDEKDYLASPLSSPINSISSAKEMVQNEAFAAEDEELQLHQQFANKKQSEATDTWGDLPLLRKSEEEDLPQMVKSSSVYFDAVDVEANALNAVEDSGDYCTHPSMSLCGHLLAQAETEEEIHCIFAQHIIPFDFFRANFAAIFANPNLRFLVDNKVSPYNEEMQAYLVSRVLFPYSQHLTVGTSESCSNAGEKNANNSRLAFALEPLEEICSDDGGSTQDTASCCSEGPYFKKSLKPSQEEFVAMNLRSGANEIAFVLQGTSKVVRIEAKLYLWPVSAKIVIAQIDGAISSSVTGSMFKRKDPGAVEFYTKVAQNGYKLVYVTANGEVALPMGPVLLSPATFSNEMIDAQDFKAAAFGALRALFPNEMNPFYAAFGATQIDCKLFAQIGVFSGKVFVVDRADGSLRHSSLLGFHESFTSLWNRMDGMFPPICTTSSNNLQLVATKSGERFMSETVRNFADEAYNDVNFWRIEPKLLSSTKGNN